MAEKSPYEKLLEQHGVQGRFVPRCDWPGCGAAACHGHGVRLLKGIRGIWYCPPHQAAFLAGQQAAAREALPRPANGVRQTAAADQPQARQAALW